MKFSFVVISFIYPLLYISYCSYCVTRKMNSKYQVSNKRSQSNYQQCDYGHHKFETQYKKRKINDVSSNSNYSSSDHMSKRKQRCQHCKFVAQKASIYYWKNTKVVVQPFVKQYSLNMMPIDHIESDEDLLGILNEGIGYALGLGFTKPRFLVNRAPKYYCDGFKEHLHVQICFDREPELFDQIFTNLTGETITDGYLNRTLIINHAKKKNKVGRTMVESMPDEGDIIYDVSEEEIKWMFKDQIKFNYILNFASINKKNEYFNPITSELYMFVNMCNSNVTSMIFSFGASK